MDAVWVNELYIATAPAATEGGEPTWSKLCKGIEGMTFSENEQNQQYFFICGEGFAHNETTGAAPELVITGRRIVGDAAQDYIAGMQFKLGPDRNSKVIAYVNVETLNRFEDGTEVTPELLLTSGVLSKIVDGVKTGVQSNVTGNIWNLLLVPSETEYNELIFANATKIQLTKNERWL